MSRRKRVREKARPWTKPQNHQAEHIDDQHDNPDPGLAALYSDWIREKTVKPEQQQRSHS